MSPHAPPAVFRRRHVAFSIAAFLFVLGFLVVVPATVRAQTSPVGARQQFDLPSGAARPMLRQFAAQAKQEIVFDADAVEGFTTNAVKGKISAREALDRMLAGTGLVASQDKSGAFAVRKETERELKNGNRAIAQDSDRPNKTAHAEDGVLKLDIFEVKGVREPGPVNQGVIPRKEGEAVPYQIFDRATIDRSGALSLGEFFRNYSGNTARGVGYQGIYGDSVQLAVGIVETRDIVNLRGLGGNRTVLLLNGRRLYGSDYAGADISRIPLDIVDRIEILSGAGGAIYGANAVGGAINIITRRAYVGSETTLYAGTSTRGGGTEWHASVFQGFATPDSQTSGTVMFEHQQRGGIHMGDRNYFNDAIARNPIGTIGFRTLVAPYVKGPYASIYNTTTPQKPLLIPGNPDALYAYVPPGTDGTNVTPATFSSTAGKPYLGDRLSKMYLQNPESTDTINAQAEHTFIKDRLDAYVELAWRYYVSETDVPGGGGGSGTLAASSPLNPFRTGVTPGFVGVAISAAWDPIDVPLDHSYALQRTARVVGGLKGKLGVENAWAWAMDFSYDRNEGFTHNTSYAKYLSHAVLLGLYNPFRDLTLYPNAISLDLLRNDNEIRNIPEIYLGNVRVSGPLWSLPGGLASISAGGEARQEEFKTVQKDNFSKIYQMRSPAGYDLLYPSSNGMNHAQRRANAEYVELTVPLFGAPNRRPLLYDLNLSLAARHEAYGNLSYRSTFNDGTSSGGVQPSNLKDTPLTAALKWAPVRDVAFRASYAQTFVAPTMNQLFTSRGTFLVSSALTYYDPLLNQTFTAQPGTVSATSGGNPALLPEHGYSLDYGVIFTPRGLPGLTATVDYYRIAIRDQISTPSLTTLLLYFPGRLTRDSNRMLTAYDYSAINIGEVITKGADVKVDYTFTPGPIGAFTWSAVGTYVEAYRQKAIAGEPFLSLLNDLTAGEVPLRVKYQTSLAWTRAALGASLSANYTGHYKDLYNTNTYSPLSETFQPDGPWIGSLTTFDAQFTYERPRAGAGMRGWRAWTADTRYTIGALNVFDRRPPYTSADPSFYSQYGDPRQRFLYVEARKKF